MIETETQREKRTKAEASDRAERAARYAEKMKTQLAPKTVVPAAVPIATYPDAPLTVLSAKTLTKEIKDHLHGAAALILRAHRLEAWRVLGYPSWIEYARQEFSVARSQAYRLLGHAKTVEILTDEASPMGETPENERQTRPLNGLLPSAKKKAWKKAVKAANGQQPTAAQVAAAVDEMKPAKAREVPPAGPEPKRCPHCGKELP